MEIDGHPTQDLVEELQGRGAVRVEGSTSGPHPDTTLFLQERMGEAEGFWLFLPYQTFATGFDEVPT